MAKKIGIKKVKDPNGKSKRLKPFEDNFQLVSFLEYREGKSKVGATLLEKKKSEDYKVVFGFQCRGISPILSDEQIMDALARLDAGSKDLLQGETLTIHFGNFVDDTARQVELSQLMKATDTPEVQLLLGGERKRVQELTQEGIRSVNFLNIYGTFTVEQGEQQGNSDMFDKMLRSMEKGWQKFTGTEAKIKARSLQRIILDAYNRGYQRWSNLLSDQMGLTITPMSAQELWAVNWNRLNVSPPRTVPQTIVIENEEFREEVKSRVHPKSLLLHESVPKAHRDCISVKNQFTGVLLQADKPDGWVDEEHQIRYLWEVISRQTVYDTEIFCQLQRGNPKVIREMVRSLSGQSNLSATMASEKNKVDVGAELNAQETMEAEAALHSGAQPIYMSLIYLIHRPTKKQVNRACQDFMALFQRQGWVVRETEYAWKIWLDTFTPMIWNKQLTKPFNRRSIYLSSEAPGLMPMVCNRSLDKKGFELISVEGGNPINLNLFEKHRNLGIFATTRSGKSVMVAGLLVQALARGIPVTALDFPRPDGTGTFNDFCNSLPNICSYFDIGNLDQGINLMEPPNLKGFTKKLQVDRFNDFKVSLLGILRIMVLGIGGRSLDVNPDAIESLLTLALEQFYQDDLILNRFGEAFNGGFGSGEWQQMPTLKDFIPFCSLERLQLINPSTDTIKALDFIKLRLRYWLESRVGKVLSVPTTFPSDAQMLVVALRNLSSDVDAAVLVSLVYLAALRRSLAFPVSFYFLDEAPILFEYDEISKNVARLCANGAKSGIRVIINAQEPLSIAQSAGGAKVLANISTRLIGRIQPPSLKDYVDVFRYPQWLIEPCTGEGFKPNKMQKYSNWILDDDGILVPVRHYPSIQLLSLVANNPEESKMRTEFMEKYSGDKVRALFEFAQYFAQRSAS